MNDVKILATGLRALQQRVLDDKGVSPRPCVEQILQRMAVLRQMMDSEIRHVSLFGFGANDALECLFAECVSFLSVGRKVDENVICDWLIDEIFVPKNRLHDNNFADFGVVGIVIRLLDYEGELKKTGDQLIVAHLANYAIMGLSLMPEYRS